MQSGSNLALKIVGSVSIGAIRFTASIFKWILWLIDKDRVHHAEQVIEQEDLSNELDILVHVTKVKEDALSRGAWTNAHSLTLNELSQKLYDDCEWSKDMIHSYMREIVESIPGLAYVPGDDDDDDDDDISVNV
jgi:hypothetical protein